MTRKKNLAVRRQTHKLHQQCTQGTIQRLSLDNLLMYQFILIAIVMVSALGNHPTLGAWKIINQMEG